MAAEQLLMAGGNYQGIATGIQPCKKPDAPEATTASWFLLAATVKITRFANA